jgi:hypothetical protein
MELIVEETFADAELTQRLTMTTVKGRRFLVKYTLDDLDLLLGYIAAEANHCKDRKLQREFDRLYVRLQKAMQAYDDGAWQQAF